MRDFIEVDTEGWEFDNLEEWFKSLSPKDLLFWTKMLVKEALDEEESVILVETAALIYCKEMEIKEIPSSDEFINVIAKNFARNFHLLKLQKLGLIEVEGTLNMIDINTKVKITEKGINIVDTMIVNPEANNSII